MKFCGEVKSGPSTSQSNFGSDQFMIFIRGFLHLDQYVIHTVFLIL